MPSAGIARRSSIASLSFTTTSDMSAVVGFWRPHLGLKDELVIFRLAGLLSQGRATLRKLCRGRLTTSLSRNTTFSNQGDKTRKARNKKLSKAVSQPQHIGIRSTRLHNLNLL